MKYLITLLLCAGILVANGQQATSKKKNISVYCDHYPQFKINDAVLDSTGLKAFVKDEVTQNKNDSICFVIECPDNITIEAFQNTERIISFELISIGSYDGKVTVYNRCIKQFSFQGFIAKDVAGDINIIEVKVDSLGNMFLANDSVTADFICTKYKGQNLTVVIDANRKLPVEKLTQILDKLYAAKFTVTIKTLQK